MMGLFGHGVKPIWPSDRVADPGIRRLQGGGARRNTTDGLSGRQTVGGPGPQPAERTIRGPSYRALTATRVPLNGARFDEQDERRAGDPGEQPELRTRRNAERACQDREQHQPDDGGGDSLAEAEQDLRGQLAHR